MRFRQRLDQILWAIVTALPVLAYLLRSINGSPTFVSIMDEFTGVQFMADIMDTLESAGINLPEFLVSFSVWVALVYFAHLLIDVLLFVPKIGTRLCEKWFRRASE